jgi:apolipoprotein N-acyltransferase
MNPTTAVQTAHEMGFAFPSPAWIFGCILFGLVGLAAWRYGKVVERPRIRWLGVALMFYPYLTSRTWMLYGVGIALCAVIWWDRPRRG